jgi:Kef-type K+ transport system membrane component KefB
MILLQVLDISLPLTNPTLKFFIILVIILFAPLLLNKLRIPNILGLIMAGAAIGPHGFNLILRDSGIILSGTAGLLYIMFLAGIEIDLADFRKNRSKSTILGLMGFLIPMVLGTSLGLYFLGFSLPTSLLLASMFSSHTLITYPIIQKIGIVKNRAVNITVGSTLITNIMALLVLAVIVGHTTGNTGNLFWIRLGVSIVLFGALVWFVFPLIGRWFFKRYDDNVSQYIFVLAMVFLGAVMAEIAGIEGIIGAFLAGLALNRLIPQTSPLMNRIDFVGNAIFIPFFLIGVGMLIDFRVFLQDITTIKVALAMTAIATLGKYLVAWLSQKSFGYTLDERRVIFGLSNAQAAATLAAVLIGYNIVTGISPDGEPMRLLNDSVLNGTIIMILVTCTIASFMTQKGAQNIALVEAAEMGEDEQGPEERILIPISNPETTVELVNLSVMIKSKKNKTGLYALNIINNTNPEAGADRIAAKILDTAVETASATDNYLNRLLRYDLNIVNGITSVIKEHGITDLVLGLHVKKGISESFLGNLTEGILTKCNATTLVYKPSQPLATIKRHLVVVPEHASKEIGFPFWLLKVWNIARNSGAKIVFYGAEKELHYIREINVRHHIDVEFVDFSDWNDFLIVSRDVKQDDGLIIILSRKNKPSYHGTMANIPDYLNKYFRENSFILVYPIQMGVSDATEIDLNNPSLLEPIEKLDDIGKTIAGIFRKK